MPNAGANVHSMITFLNLVSAISIFKSKSMTFTQMIKCYLCQGLYNNGAQTRNRN